LGLSLLTKGTAYFFVAPLLCMSGAMLLRHRQWRRVAALIPVGVVMLAVNVGFYDRNFEQFGTPIGPQYGVAVLTPSVRTLASNIIRNVASNFATQSEAINSNIVRQVAGLHDLLGLNLNDPVTTWPGTQFGLSRQINFEDFAPNPLQLLAIIATLGLICAGYRSKIIINAPNSLPLRSPSNNRPIPRAVYAASVLAGGVLFCLMLRWQPWITRLQLPFFALMAPVVAATLERSVRRGWLVAGCALFLLAALPWALGNGTRPLWNGPVLKALALPINRPYLTISVSRWDMMFRARPELYPVYRDAISAVRSRAGGGIGLATGEDSWEYPMWAIANDDTNKEKIRIEHVCLITSESPAIDANFKPGVLLLLDRDSPQILTCGNQVFEKEVTFSSPSGSKAFTIDVYHRQQP